MKENVLRFQISVQDVIIMHILYCMTHLLHNTTDFFLGESALEFQVFINATRKAQFHE